MAAHQFPKAPMNDRLEIASRCLQRLLTREEYDVEAKYNYKGTEMTPGQYAVKKSLELADALIELSKETR